MTEEIGVDIFQQILTGVSVDRMRTHIRALEGTRDPVEAPAALEKAATSETHSNPCAAR
ncbi:MAG TPA: hypothetical protein VHN12_07025 [Geobacteraceae bacterium]|nr:hypothetical protein [Geobacteraceae bacterium]